MAGLIYYTEKRRVLPQIERARTYADTSNVTKDVSKAGKAILLLPRINLKVDNLDIKISEWKKTKNHTLAGDILSQALMLNDTEQIDVFKKYLLTNFPKDDIFNWLLTNVSDEISNEHKISYNFKKLKLEPYDSLTWTDQAINFLETNDRAEAIRCIEEALKINSSLGFIVRNASRIFSLTGDNGRSIKLLKNSEYYRYDPQILSAEIAFSQLENRKTTGIEIGRQLVNDSRYINREKSELASALGTIEYFKGEYKKSEKLFDLSLLDPNKNSLAQSLWYKKDIIPTLQLNTYQDSNEIQTHLHSKSNEFEKSLEYALKWKDDEPYNSRPFNIASNIMGTILGKYDKAFDLYKKCLTSQRDIKGSNFTTQDEMNFNNDLAYYLLKSNRIDEAIEYISPAFSLQNKATKLDDHEYINIATIGLLAYKQDNSELGRQLYKKTIKHFSDTKQYYLLGSAFLNFFDEEINVLQDLDSLQKLRKELDSTVTDMAQGDLLYRKEISIKLFDSIINKIK